LPFVLVLLGYAFILLIDRVLIDSHDTGGFEVFSEIGSQSHDSSVAIDEALLDDGGKHDPFEDFTVRSRSRSIQNEPRGQQLAINSSFVASNAGGAAAKPHDTEMEFKSMFSKLDKFSRA